MPFPDISIPAFPDVPSLPGVPALLRQAGAYLPLPVTAVADALGLGSLVGPKWGIFDSKMKSIVQGASVLGIDFVVDARVSDFPVEAPIAAPSPPTPAPAAPTVPPTASTTTATKTPDPPSASFASYNKVQTPFSVKMTFVIGGSFSLISAAEGVYSAISAGSLGGALSAITGETARTKFLAAIDAAVKSTLLYSVVTPTVTYPNVTVTHYDYRRSSRNGATMLTVDVWLQEFRMAPAPAFTSAATTTPSGATAVDQGTVQPPAVQGQGDALPALPVSAIPPASPPIIETVIPDLTPAPELPGATTAPSVPDAASQTFWNNSLNAAPGLSF